MKQQIARFWFNGANCTFPVRPTQPGVKKDALFAAHGQELSRSASGKMAAVLFELVC